MSPAESWVLCCPSIGNEEGQRNLDRSLASKLKASWAVSHSLVNPIHSAAMPPPGWDYAIVCVWEVGTRNVEGPFSRQKNDDEKMYFILLEEAIWLCLLYQQHDLGGCLSRRQKTLQFPRDFKTNLPLWWAMSNEDMCSAQMLDGFGEIVAFCSYFLSNTLQWNDAEKLSLDLTEPGEVSQQPFGHHRQGDACEPQSWHKEAHIGQ